MVIGSGDFVGSFGAEVDSVADFTFDDEVFRSFSFDVGLGSAGVGDNACDSVGEAPRAGDHWTLKGLSSCISGGDESDGITGAISGSLDEPSNGFAVFVPSAGTHFDLFVGQLDGRHFVLFWGG